MNTVHHSRYPFSVIQTKRSVGFTLIELLVVVAIIGILAAILFPVFAAARDKARQSACLNNIHQLGLAILEYNNDYDEMEPIVCSQATPTAATIALINSTGVGAVYNQQNHFGWIECIYPYVKSSKVFICPSDAQRDFLHNYNAGYAGSSYAINRYLGWTPAHDPAATTPGIGTGAADTGGLCNSGALDQCGDMPYSLAKIQTPTTHILLSEFGQVKGGPTNTQVNGGFNRTSRGSYSEIPARSPQTENYLSLNYAEANGPPYNNVFATHNNLGNILFCDGHVQVIHAGTNSYAQPASAAPGINEWIPTDVYPQLHGTRYTSMAATPEYLWETHWYPDVQ